MSSHYFYDLFLENLEQWKMPSKFWQSEPLNTYFTYIPPILKRFPCSQTHNLLICDQPHPKDNFSPIKKIRNFDPFWRDNPLTNRTVERFNLHSWYQYQSKRKFMFYKTIDFFLTSFYFLSYTFFHALLPKKLKFRTP